MKVFLFLLFAFIGANAITRQEVIQRAAFWVAQKVYYSMSNYHADPHGVRYRTDCSGYVSMAWKLGPPGLSTVTIPGVAHHITKAQLAAGDIMCHCGAGTGGAGGHVLLFERWTDAAHNTYMAYEQHGHSVTSHRSVQYPYFGNDHRFVPMRYNHIQ